MKKLSGELKECLDDVSKRVDDELNALLPAKDKGTSGERRIAEAMRYSAISGGKRLRPFLVVSCANLFGVSSSVSLKAAVAVECIHTYSLIHDDLPAMDNDDLRRGKPSNHKEFDEATAILAGDGLLAFAFEIISHPDTTPENSIRAELCQAFAKASGASGLVGGQMMDILAENQELPLQEINRMQRMKTGALFALSCEIGAILGKGNAQHRNALRGYAYDMGLAFQITDDLLDAEGTEASTGKTVRTDKAAGKQTYVSAMGVEKARMQARLLSEQAQQHLVKFDSRAKPLRDLAAYVVDRDR